jgi:hypothetical protein
MVGPQRSASRPLAQLMTVDQSCSRCPTCAASLRPPQHFGGGRGELGIRTCEPKGTVVILISELDTLIPPAGADPAGLTTSVVCLPRNVSLSVTRRDGAGRGNPPMPGQAMCRNARGVQPQARRAVLRQVVAAGLPDRRAVQRGAWRAHGRGGAAASAAGWKTDKRLLGAQRTLSMSISILTLGILPLSSGLVGARLLSASRFGENRKSPRTTVEGERRL